MSQEKTFRISSNLTLILKMGFPIFWIIFFGSIALGFLISSEEKVMYTPLIVRLSFIGLFVLFFLILYFTVMNLKRVEMGTNHIYVSNYFKTYRYAFKDVESIKSFDFGLIQILSIRLKEKAKLGRKLPFMVSKARLKEYLDSNNSSEFISLQK